jgi:rRNA maturation endonuclease Nob1
MKINKFPDKTRTLPNGRMEIITTRDIPVCPSCGTNLVRKRAKN